MTIQAVLLGIIVPIFLGAVFHLWCGGPGWRLGLYIILAEVGFWLGHLAATSWDWEFIKVGALQLGTGLISSLLVIGLGYWLSYKQPETDKKKPLSSVRGVRK